MSPDNLRSAAEEYHEAALAHERVAREWVASAERWRRANQIAFWWCRAAGLLNIGLAVWRIL